MRRRPTRRSWSIFGAVVMVAAASVVIVGAADATLPGSSFNTTNGSLTSLAIHDWNPAGSPAGNVGPIDPITCPALGAGTNCGVDRTNSSLDDSFAKGPKEDDLAPAVGAGSIPPNKDDLSRFYINQEKAGGNDYLYLAWERTNTLGSAHMDFEFNQSSTNSTNGVTKVRTEGDMLVTFDFGGSGVPTLSLSRWLTAGNGHVSSDCEVPSDGIPCWSALENLTTAGVADGSVNNANVLDYNPPGAPRTLAGSVSSNGSVSSTFGEAGINLTAAGVFSPGTCQHFGAASLKSRSSGQSFTSTLKDFIAPIPVNISNCGTITIIKHTDPRGVNQNFNYTSNIAGSSLDCTTDTTPATFTLNDSGNATGDNAANTETCANVPAGSYTVTEGADPANFTLESLTCTADPNSSGSQDGTNDHQANITLAADETVTCTFVNQQQLGAIKITKTSTKGNAPLAGVQFSITKGGTAISGSPFTTAADGTICVDGLGFGDYVVTETAAPTGYSINDSTGHTVTVDNNAKCTDNPFVGETTGLSFSDTPLTDLLVKATGEAAPAGTTKSQITCTDSTSANIGNSPTLNTDPATMTANGLKPGTYTCKIVIDP
jgi:hypothetical protein